ncbi:MAG: hypothetical protein LBJ12_00900 [Oscillospiraceae bacterium]|jgi:hypothetical protein|nr:hypothetical protein [Oscillospiraceae bacterium]
MTDKMQCVLDDAFKLLGNPIVMIDTSYNLLLHTENPVKDDPLWNELLALGEFSHETVDFFNSAQFIKAVADSDVVALLRSDKLPYDRACGKFFDWNGIQLGSICVVACVKPFESGDFEKITTVCEHLSAENCKNGTARITEQFFSELWLGKLLETKAEGIDDVPIPEHLHQKLVRNLFVGVIDISQYEKTFSHLAYFRDVFSKLVPEFFFFVYLNNVVMLISTDLEDLGGQEGIHTLRSFFEKYNLFAGVSGSFKDLRQLRSYYRLAIDALNRGMNQPSNEHVFWQEAFGIEHIVKHLANAEDLEGLCNPAVLQLCEFDKQNGSNYLELLHTYLRTAKNATLSCKQLQTKPDELRESLQRLGSLFEIDWDNGEQLTSLLISIELFKRKQT